MIEGGKVTASGGNTFAALKKRLAQGKGQASSLSRTSRAFKTSWAKGNPKISKGNPTFAAKK